MESSRATATRFASSAVALAALSPSVEAAVQYTASGVTLTVGSPIFPITFAGLAGPARFNVDLLSFVAVDSSEQEAQLLPGTASAMAVFEPFVGGGSDYAPNAFPSGESIGAGRNFISLVGNSWIARTFIDEGLPFTDGNFAAYYPNQERFVGVRFQDGANTHYGWIGFTWNPAVASLVVSGWAWEDTPNTPILTAAGIPVPVVAGLGGGGSGGKDPATIRRQQQQQAAAARVAREKVAQQHRRNQQR